MQLIRSNRRLRRMKVMSGHWQRRFMFLAGGIMVGAVAVLLAYLADQVQHYFALLIAHWRYAPLAVTPLGFVLAVFLTNRYFPNSQGSGIPQAIAARQLTDHAARKRLVSLRVAAGKILLTLLGLLCGASSGREGPTGQVGASIRFAGGTSRNGPFRFIAPWPGASAMCPGRPAISSTVSRKTAPTMSGRTGWRNSASTRTPTS